MLSGKQSERLVRVEGDAPMARMMRDSFWVPFARVQSLVADGAPVSVRLLGRSYVAFRATDGRAALFDEPCPHRGCSLLLARNEENGLRCIFHGWKFSADGRCVEIPSEADRGAALGPRVKVAHHPVVEKGGLLWAWLGERAPAPFPPLPFTDLSGDHVWMTRTPSACNWLQGIEATVDSVHVGTLHQSWIKRSASNISNALDSHPRYEVEDTSYGLRAAALRPIADGRTYVRVSEYVMPFVSLIAPSDTTRGTAFIVTPVDDHNHLLFFGFWNRQGSAAPSRENTGTIGGGEGIDLDNYANFQGDKSNVWGQNRQAMKQGHFTGFDRLLLQEDIVTQVSMGPIVDRSKEQLAPGDLAVVRTRQRLLAALDEFEAKGSLSPSHDEIATLRGIDAVLDKNTHWRERQAVAAQ